MKVCIYTNHFYPEDFKVNDIAFELASKGYDVTVLTAIPDYPKGTYFEGYSLFKRRRENVNGVKVIRLPIIPRRHGGAKRLIMNFLSYFFALSVFTFFHKFFHKYDKVFVHITSPFYPAVCARKLAKWQKIPLFVWVLDLWPESLTSAGGISSRIIIGPETRRVQKVYDTCEKILISSKGFESFICDKGNYKDKLVYFPNWAEDVDCNINSDFDISTVAPFNNITENDFVVLFAGNIGDSQNLEASLEAAVKLKDHKDIKFVYVGDGRCRQELMAYAFEHKLSETVFFPGRFPLETMPVFMKRADVLLCSLRDKKNYYFTVPAKVQFYMSQAKPVLAMINGEGAALIKEANCGKPVPSGDSDALVEAILDLKGMAGSDLEIMGKNGADYYARYFKKDLRITQLIGLLG